MQLPGEFAPPRGRLLLALTDTLVAGCACLHDAGDGVCEVRRLYVRPKARGLGVGQALLTTLIDEARTIGYIRMRVELLNEMLSARALLDAVGFVQTAPYRPLTSEDDRTTCMALALHIR